MIIWHPPIEVWNPAHVPRKDDGHPGSFGFERRHHYHEGVDLYTAEHAPVLAVEAGVVVSVRPFTGAALGHTWWNDTDAVLVHGASGLVVYGELRTNGVQPGDWVRPGQIVGHVVQVLKKDKGRPMSMLHLELRDADHPDSRRASKRIKRDQIGCGIRHPTSWLFRLAKAYPGARTFMANLGL